MNDLQKIDAEHHLSPFSDWAELKAAGGRKIISKAKGVHIWDNNGKQMIDAMSGLWCVNAGYSCQSIVDAVTQQLQEVPYYNAFFKTSNEPAANLCQILNKITPPNISHFFFNSSGSEANDTVYRFVRYYYNLRGQTQKRFFISRKNAYHGSTVWGASLGGMLPMHKQMDEGFRSYIHHIEQPYSFDTGKDYNDPAFGVEAAGWLEEKILELGPENVAAFVGEPIQGAGGVIIPPDNYWKEIRKICDKYEVLLNVDEVICGFWRTGECFGCQTYGIEPDLMTMAKGITSGYIPLSAIGISSKLAAEVSEHEGEFYHGYTYSAHPVACAAAIGNLTYLQENKIPQKVQEETIPYFSQAIQAVKDHELVGEVRSKGMMAAFEIVKDKKTRQRWECNAATLCRDICIDVGVISRACGQTMVMAPALVITNEEIDEIMEKFQLALDKTAEKLRKENLR